MRCAATDVDPATGIRDLTIPKTLQQTFKHADCGVYAEVIAGGNMPNLIYMTSFENLADRDAHWKTFGNDPEWKKLSSDPIYQHNVSKIDIILMKAASYSDY